MSNNTVKARAYISYAQGLARGRERILVYQKDHESAQILATIGDNLEKALTLLEEDHGTN